MNVVEATRAYEHWLRAQVPVVERDLRLKHKLMQAGPFSLLRASFYRWVPLWRETCPDLAKAPAVLAVGDLHVENFGTWRDAEARLVWGINDVDEATAMPYTLDLTRLATSALLAREEQHLAIPPKLVCKLILKGYQSGLDAALPFILEEAAGDLRRMALSSQRAPDAFWAKLDALPNVAAPSEIRKFLAQQMPHPLKDLRMVRRVAGLGALGRPRHTALAEFAGGNLAREAKRMLPSAYDWATGKLRGHGPAASPSAPRRLLAAAVRSRDPWHVFSDGWQIRRLAPHCARIELAMLPARRDEELLLAAMGRETANLHLGSRHAIPALRRDLHKRPKGWLLDAATAMAKATVADWKEWKRRG